MFYHGVGASGMFDKFDKSFIGSTSGNFGHYGKGFYFTDTYRKAKAFSKAYGGTGEVIVAKLNIKNPFIVNEENLAYIGEKYKLNIPKKIPVAIDIENLLAQLKEKDQVAYELLFLMHKTKSISSGWKEFMKKHHRTFEGETGIDLNIITDWYEETLGERYGRAISEYSVQEMKEMGINPKFIYDYPENLNMAYLTNLGQNAEEWTEAIKSEGYDGIYAGEEIVVFEPEQIKILSKSRQ